MKNQNHLAFIACHHEQIFALFDSANDREESHFLEEISNFEAEILGDYFRLDNEMEKRFGGFTGEMIITGENSEIIHHEKPAHCSLLPAHFTAAPASKRKLPLK